MSRYICPLALAAALLAGCAGDRTSGTVREAMRIKEGERIVVLWYTGQFVDPFIQETMAKDGTNGKPYENCTNAWIEQTFRMNGYPAAARRVGPADRPVAPRDVRVVLVIYNKTARINRIRSQMGAAEGFGTVILDMEVDLRDRASGKSLWRGNEAFFTDARRNAAPVLRIVRGLAADGYLERQPENIRDYAGRIGANEELPACPL